MKYKFAITLFLLAGLLVKVKAQHIGVNLSQRHAEKLNQARNARDRLMMYYRFYKKDSLRDVRLQKKRARKWARGYWNELRRPNGGPDFAQSATFKTPMLTDSLFEAAPQHSTDSLSALLKSQSVADTFALRQLFDSPEALEEGANAVELLQRKAMDLQNAGGPGNGLSRGDQNPLSDVPLPMNIRRDFGQPEPGGLTHFGRDKAGAFAVTGADRLTNDLSEKAADLLADAPEVIGSARASISKLLNRYRSFASSGDPGSGIKHSSMKGKSLRERLSPGGNFSLVSTQPVAIDLSPVIAYKFTSVFEAGFGLNYRISFDDSISQNNKFCDSNTSLRLFAAYEVLKGFRVYGEWERSEMRKRSEQRDARWRDHAFVGISKKMLIHPRLYLSVTGLYNLCTERENPVYPQRFVIRTGFQLSELATRRKPPLFHPNRFPIE